MDYTIMLVCAAGMSTSLLVAKMKKAATESGIEAEIFAVSSSEFKENVETKEINCVLLGPQVRFLQEQFKKDLVNKDIPIEVIKTSDYGTMNGKNVLNQAMNLIHH